MDRRPDAPDASSQAAPLGPIRVVDATDEYGAYAGRLLADLGADVVRVELPGDRVRVRHPHVETPAGTASAFGWFVNVNKRTLGLDVETQAGAERLRELVADADVLLHPWDAARLAALGIDEPFLRERAPRLVAVAITPYGTDGPWASRSAVDLTTLASGGLLSLGGYPDAEPVAVAGGQALFAASIFGAVAAVLGLVGRERDGLARRYDVSGQEAIAGALEDAIPQFDLTGRVRRRAGDQPREAGTGIYACADGYVSMVAGRLGTARAWKALTEWLVEEGVEGAEELLGERWQSFPFRQLPEAIDRFRTIFERFTRGRTKRELYLEAQRRSIALAPVNEVADLFTDPQLEARDFFRSVVPPELGRPVLLPGRPYRLGHDETVAFLPARPLGEPESGAEPGSSPAHLELPAAPTPAPAPGAS